MESSGKSESTEGMIEDILAAPVVQIFSVHLSTEFDDGRPCEVYGSIRITEGRGTSVDLYDRGLADCEAIYKHGTLSLSGPEGYAILGSKEVAIDLHLKDKTRGIELIKGSLYLGSTSQDSFDKLMKVVFEGEHGRVFLYYITFRFGISTVVKVAIANKEDGIRQYDDVYGSIVAYYGNNRQYCSSNDEVKYLETSLFEKSPDMRVRSLMGTPLKLLRSVVAVPAYSSLIVEVRLFGSQGQFTGRVVFPVEAGAYDTQSIPSENGHTQLEITVEWNNVYPLIYKETRLNCDGAVIDTKDEQSRTEEPSKKARVLPDQQLTSYSNQTYVCQTPGSKIDGCRGMEIFSVYVGGIDCEVSTICGTITVYHGCHATLIYDKTHGDYEVLNDDKLACIGGDVAFRNSEFEIAIDLKDPIRNLEISKGYYIWNAFRLRMACLMSWFDRRVCSVIRGKHGYAAVHYIIFTSAVKARLKVLFFCDNDVPHYLHGTLSALYSGHEYSADLEKICYQSRLFNRPMDKALQVRSGSGVVLLKSLVMVPTTSALIIESGLSVTWDGNSHGEVLSGKQVFNIDPSSTAKEFRGGSCRIVVSVKFESCWII